MSNQQPFQNRLPRSTETIFWLIQQQQFLFNVQSTKAIDVLQSHIHTYQAFSNKHSTFYSRQHTIPQETGRRQAAHSSTATTTAHTNVTRCNSSYMRVLHDVYDTQYTGQHMIHHLTMCLQHNPWLRSWEHPNQHSNKSQSGYNVSVYRVVYM